MPPASAVRPLTVATSWIVPAGSCPSVAAVEMATRRKAVTSGDLTTDQDALMAGIEAVLGPLPERCTLAWHRACGLFADVIAGLIFNPFRDEPGT